MWRLMNQRGQGGIVGGMVGLVVGSITLYITFLILATLTPLIGNAVVDFSNAATIIVIWGIIPLLLIFGLIISVWQNMTSSRQQPPQY